MKIYIGNDSKQKIGGGFTFLRNFQKGVEKFAKDKIQITDNPQEADLLFIAGSTMVDKELVEDFKARGKKIVLRVDNITKNSRNRGTGTSRMKKYADMADLVIYQSEWAKEYVGYFLDRDGKVIHNGVDSDYFNPNVTPIKTTHKYNFLYTRFNRDDSKRPEEAFMIFHYWWRKHKDSKLWIVGNFSDELRSYNFDFFMDEPIEYIPAQPHPEQMASIYRACDVTLLPYWMDACSNTILESEACGTPVLCSPTGGNPELLVLPWSRLTLNDMNLNVENIETMLKIDYRSELGLATEDDFGLENMTKKYVEAFYEA